MRFSLQPSSQTRIMLSLQNSKLFAPAPMIIETSLTNGRAGEQRLKSIKAAGLKRLSEEEFFEMLKTGVPPETLDRVDSHESDDEPVKKKQKKKH